MYECPEDTYEPNPFLPLEDSIEKVLSGGCLFRCDKGNEEGPPFP